MRISTLLLITILTPHFALAQFEKFAVTNADVEFTTIQSSGAAAMHGLRVTAQANGSITGAGRRFDIAANEVSPNPTNGRIVRVLTNGPAISRLGQPVTSSTNVQRWTNTYTYPVYGTNGMWLTNSEVIAVLRNWTIETTCPFAVFLSDGARIKGVATHYEFISETWDYDRRRKGARQTNEYIGISGEATHKGGFGSGLSWGNNLPSGSSGGGGGSGGTSQ